MWAAGGGAEKDMLTKMGASTGKVKGRTVKVGTARVRSARV